MYILFIFTSKLTVQDIVRKALEGQYCPQMQNYVFFYLLK